MMSNHLHTIALPEFLQQTQEELDDKDFDITDLFCGNQLTKLPLDTVYQWLHHLGLLLKLEKRMLHWTQLPLAQVKDMEENFEGLG